MRVAAEVVLTEEQAAQLKAHARGRRTAARLVLRARIVLLAAEGKQDLEIASALGIVPRTAARWRARFLTSGVAGLEKDGKRPRNAPFCCRGCVMDSVYERRVWNGGRSS